VVIYDAGGQIMKAHNINDIRFIKKSISWLGWKLLTATPSEIDSSVDFWKRCWETGLIDSDYLDQKYKRKN
jgi:predicted nicotinamide N-methyase